MAGYPRKSFGDSARGGGFRPRGGRPSFGDREERRLFTAQCATCGRECQVPFEPNGKKPVYCKDHFVRSDDGERRDFDRRDAPRASFARPAPRPAAVPARPDPRIDQLAKEVRALDQKLDTVVELLRAQALSATIKKVTKKKTAKK